MVAREVGSMTFKIVAVQENYEKELLTRFANWYDTDNLSAAEVDAFVDQFIKESL